MKNIGKATLIFILGIIVSFSMNVAAEVVLSSESVSYFNSKTNETTVNGALDELFSAIEISNQIGDMTKIASIGDGTIAGAILNINNTVSGINSKVDWHKVNNVTDIPSTASECMIVTHATLTNVEILNNTVIIPYDVLAEGYAALLGGFVFASDFQGYYSINASTSSIQYYPKGNYYSVTTKALYYR